MERKKSMMARTKLNNANRLFAPCNKRDVMGDVVGDKHASAWKIKKLLINGYINFTKKTYKRFTKNNKKIIISLILVIFSNFWRCTWNSIFKIKS